MKVYNKLANGFILILVMSITFYINAHAGKTGKKSPVPWEVLETGTLNDKDADSKFHFTYITDMEADSTGTLYILDRNAIFKFNPDGKFAGKVSRRGRGPGEYSQPVALSVDKSDNLIISDYRRLIVVHKKSGKAETITLDFSFMGKVGADKNGNYYGLRREYTGKIVKNTLVRIDRKGKILESPVSLTDPVSKVKARSGGGVMGGVMHYYAPRVLSCLLGTRGMCVAENTNNSFIVCRFNNGKSSLETIKTGMELAPATAEDKKALLKNYRGNPAHMVFSQHRPLMDRILSDEKGRVFIVHKKTIEERKQRKPFYIDIYSPGNRLLYRAVFPYYPFYIKNGKVYTVMADREHNLMIKIFTVKELSGQLEN